MKTVDEFSQYYSLFLKQPIIWGDMDAFQHINNTVYFRYFENVRMQYFEASGVNQLMLESQIGPILGATECKFLAPLTYPDNITIGTKVSQIREKRFTMEYGVFSEKLTKIVAQGSGEIVFFDYTQQCSHIIPQQVVAAIQQIES